MGLMKLAALLGMNDAYIDAENHWEWVIGSYRGVTLDITRTHTEKPSVTTTAIFLIDAAGPDPIPRRAFPRQVLEALVSDLKQAGVEVVSVGKRNYVRGNDYEYVEFWRSE